MRQAINMIDDNKKDTHLFPLTIFLLFLQDLVFLL